MMGLFSETVPRELYEDMKKARDTWQQEAALLRAELSGLMKEMIAVKRHDLGMPPAGWQAEDPLAVLGPKTRAAIEVQSGGFGDLAGHLTNWALVQTKAALAQGSGPDGDTPDEVDEMIAHAIRQGETG